MTSTRLRARRIAAGFALAAALGGCSSGAPASATGELRFVAGDGTVSTYEPGARGEPVELAGQTLDGTRLDLADLRGQVVVLNVWGSWCAPCRAEAPALERVAADTRSQGVQFVGINVKDSPAPAQAYTERFGIGYPSIDAGDGQALLALRGVLPGAPPSTAVLDRYGRVAATVFGEVDETTLRGLVDPVVAERA